MPGGMEEFPIWPAELAAPAASLVRRKHQRMRYFHPDQGPPNASPVGSAYPVLVGTLGLDGAQKRAFEEFHDWSRHRGEEFVYVLEGEVQLYTEFYEPARLRAGESFYIDSRMGHRVISLSQEDALVLWVSTHADIGED